MHHADSIPAVGIPGRKAGRQSVALVDLAIHTISVRMQYTDPFADAPEIAVDLNLGLWAIAIGVVVLEVGENLQSGLVYYAIAPPLLIYGVYKLLLLFLDEEFER